MFESVLDVTAFDPAPWAAARVQPEAFGIRLERFGTRSEEEIRKLYALACRLFHDTPGTEHREAHPGARSASRWAGARCFRVVDVEVTAASLLTIFKHHAIIHIHVYMYVS